MEDWADMLAVWIGPPLRAHSTAVGLVPSWEQIGLAWGHPSQPGAGTIREPYTNATTLRTPMSS